MVLASWRSRNRARGRGSAVDGRSGTLRSSGRDRGRGHDRGRGRGHGHDRCRGRGHDRGRGRSHGHGLSSKEKLAASLQDTVRTSTRIET